MLKPDPSELIVFSNAAELGQWLSRYHNTRKELWIRVYKKDTGVPSVTWDDIVLEALCWGWIDGIKKSFDEQTYLQRITPRRSRSAWSKVNTRHVERLILDKKMREPGLLQVNAAKADGRWAAAYAPASEVKVPQDFIDALKEMPKERAFFESLSKSSEAVIAYGLDSAKKAETRQKRFDKYLTMLSKREKP